MTRMNSSIEDLLAQYREAAVRTGDSDADLANRWHDRMHSCYKELREVEEGRTGICALMSDENTSVRLWAASHCLFWAPEQACEVLRAIQRENVFPHSFTAEITLEEFENGTLSFDY